MMKALMMDGAVLKDIEDHSSYPPVLQKSSEMDFDEKIVSIDDEYNKEYSNEEEEDWFDYNRWWKELRLYDEKNVFNTRDFGVAPYEVCQYVEDVCRISGQKGWVYNPHNSHMYPKNQRPVVEFYGHRDDQDYENYGGDAMFFEEFGEWNVGYFGTGDKEGKNVSSQHRSPPKCSYMPVTNHFVLVADYTHMLGEFYSRIYSPLIELIHFLVTVSSSTHTWPLVAVPKNWHHKKGWLSKSQKRLIKANETFKGASTTTTANNTAGLTLMKRFQKQSKFYLSGVDNKKKKMLESHHALLGLISDHPASISEKLNNLKSMAETLRDHQRNRSRVKHKEQHEESQCACVKRLFFCGYERQTVSPNGKEIPPPSPHVPPLWRITNTGQLDGKFDSGHIQRIIREQVSKHDSIKNLTREYLLEKKTRLIDGCSDDDDEDVDDEENEKDSDGKQDKDNDKKQKKKADIEGLEKWIEEYREKKRLMALEGRKTTASASSINWGNKAKAKAEPPTTNSGAVNWGDKAKPRNEETSRKRLLQLLGGTTTTARRRLTSVEEGIEVPLVTGSDAIATSNTTANVLNVSSIMENVTDDEFVSDWKIVGLTQRSDRRTWLNLGDVMNACRERFTNPSDKIVCVQIDVGSREFWNKPNLHIATHSGLSALMGVHGAQLAEAVFMPAGSLVVEFLPFVPGGMIFGEWTRWAHDATPLGKIFSHTDLDHIGLPLTIASAMHLECIASEKASEHFSTKRLYDCLDYDKNPWDDRHFTVPVDSIMDIIDKFVANGTPSKEEGRPAPSKAAVSGPVQSLPLRYCEDFLNAAGDDYVLYNVNCVPASKSATDSRSPHHYYRTREWLEEKTHSYMNSSSLLFNT